MKARFKKIAVRLALAAYACIGIITFGHALQYHSRGPMDIKVDTSLLSGVGWPLFWSWHLQQGIAEPEVKAVYRYIT